MKITQYLKVFGLSVGVFSVVLGGSAAAHVVVKPAEAPTASFQTFTVSVPSERDEPTTGLKVLIPEGLKHVSPTVKPGWQIMVDKKGEGKSAAVTAIVWSDGVIPAEFRDEFTFSAQTPAQATDLKWSAYQTYENGEVVAWDLAKDKQPKKADGSPDFSMSGPFSVTTLTAKAPIATHEDASASEVEVVANRALSMSAVAVILGLVAIFLGTRKKSS